MATYRISVDDRCQKTGRDTALGRNAVVNIRSANSYWPHVFGTHIRLSAIVSEADKNCKGLELA